LKLPPDTWVDIEAGASAVHDAEALLAAGKWREAYPIASVAYFVGRRPFLIGEDGPWARRTRLRLRELYLRALDCCIVCTAANGELADALQLAEDAFAIEPVRESTYQNLMRALAAAGNRAEALRVYERCRRVLGDELGVPPSPATEAIYNEIVLA
jgi:DNA-binding SARP family transcriptional activator